MKQKIVIKVQLCCEKCRSKALKIAAVAEGVVNSVSLEGADRDKVVVIGDGIDSACLAKALRKKFRCANIERVEEVKEKKDEKPKEVKEKKDEKKPETVPFTFLPYPPPYPPCMVYPPCVVCQPQYDASCIIM